MLQGATPPSLKASSLPHIRESLRPNQGCPNALGGLRRAELSLTGASVRIK